MVAFIERITCLQWYNYSHRLSVFDSPRVYPEAVPPGTSRQDTRYRHEKGGVPRPRHTPRGENEKQEEELVFPGKE